ncbi:MAG: 6-phosphogluconolactonase [Actinomycetota bacterium]|nr:6-phosphogluconolactonase [Actinomycetota bacterium]
MQNPNIDKRVLESDEEVGRFVAQLIINGLFKAQAEKRNFVLGCPSGRTPRSTLKALGAQVRERSLDLSNLIVVMMDEYVTEVEPDCFENVKIDAHFSCRKWAELELREALNSGLPIHKQIHPENVRCPDGAAPYKFESWIDQLGGIDLFILASGASDGHVAFNGPGEPRSSLTRIVRLAEKTRIDNLQTFPNFKDISEVPRFGASVGISTIADKSKSSIIILLGAAKRKAFEVISQAKSYDPNWPATIISECPNAILVADQAAAN